MSILAKEVLEIKFKKGCYPTERDFKDLLDSYVHKDDMVDVSQIKQTVEGISTSLPDMLNNVKSEAIDTANDYTDTALSSKVDKETGKGLSTEDYTSPEKTKLANIEIGAQVNVQPDWNQTDTSADDYIKNKPTISDVSDKIDKVNPTGSGSFSLNRKANTTIGNYSTAEGSDCTSSGYTSHAEGDSTIASNYCSHAEGASTLASNYCSHAEGDSTIASGEASHAEGSNTIASSRDQHVEGHYNIEDTNGTYVHIVGNGDSSTRSNAYTLDWSGNGTYSGNVVSKSIISKIIYSGYYNNNAFIYASRVIILPTIPYTLIEPTASSRSYCQKLLEWIIANRENLGMEYDTSYIIIGGHYPNSKGYVIGYTYGINTVNGIDKMQYANFNYYPAQSVIPQNFGYNNYDFYWTTSSSFDNIKYYSNDTSYSFWGSFTSQADATAYRCRKCSDNTYSTITIPRGNWQILVKINCYSSAGNGIIISKIGHTNAVPNSGYDTNSNILLKKELSGNSPEELQFTAQTWTEESSDSTYYVYTRYFNGAGGGNFWTKVKLVKLS